MFSNFGFKLPTNEPPAGSEQPTGNRSGRNGDRRSDYRRQQPDTRGSHGRAGY